MIKVGDTVILTKSRKLGQGDANWTEWAHDHKYEFTVKTYRVGPQRVQVVIPTTIPGFPYRPDHNGDNGWWVDLGDVKLAKPAKVPKVWRLHAKAI